MKKSIKNAILFSLEAGGFLVSELIAIATSSYGSSGSQINKRSEHVMDLMFGQLSGGEERYKEKSIRNVIYKLKKDDLIDYKDTNKGKEIYITPKGKNSIIKSNKESLPDTEYDQAKESGGKKSIKIIIFDIPEKERRKRYWLRSAIKNLGFKQLQLSVWAGNNSIPEDFLKDLKELKILKFVEIFSIGKLGTIEPIKLE